MDTAVRSAKIGIIAVAVSYLIRYIYPYVPTIVRPVKWYSHEFLKGVLICWVSAILGAYDGEISTKGFINLI